MSVKSELKCWRYESLIKSPHYTRHVIECQLKTYDSLAIVLFNFLQLVSPSFLFSCSASSLSIYLYFIALYLCITCTPLLIFFLTEYQLVSNHRSSSPPRKLDASNTNLCRPLFSFAHLCACSGYMVGGVHYGRNGAPQNPLPWAGLYPY